MRGVKWLFGLAVAATILWGGYWFIGARALEHGAGQALETPGAPLTAQGHRVRGFPNRFDLTLTEPRLRLEGFGWEAPFVQVFALSYRPHHVIVVFPPDQRLSLPDGTHAVIGARDMRASLVMRPTDNLSLERAALVAEAPVVTLPGQRLSAEMLRLALRPAPPSPPASGPVYEAVAEAEAVFPDARLLAEADPEGLFPRRYDVLRLEAELALDRPADLDAVLRGQAPGLAGLVLTGLRAVFDGIDLHARGRVTPDPSGLLNGEVTLTVTGWEALAQRLADAGILSPEARMWLAAAAPSLETAPDTIEIPLRLQAGDLRLGPVVLARIPPL